MLEDDTPLRSSCQGLLRPRYLFTGSRNTDAAEPSSFATGIRHLDRWNNGIHSAHADARPNSGLVEGNLAKPKQV